MVLLYAMRKAFQFGKATLVDLPQPALQALPFPFVQHLEKVLTQAVRCLQGWMGLAKSCQVHSFAFVQGVWMPHEETHGSA